MSPVETGDTRLVGIPRTQVKAVCELAQAGDSFIDDPAAERGICVLREALASGADGILFEGPYETVGEGV